MDILSLVRIVFRRWYVSFPLLLAAVGFAAYIQSTLPPQYEATGSILLEEPQFDPSGLPISLIEVEQLATGVQEGLEPAGSEAEVLVRARDGQNIEIIAIETSPEAAEDLAGTAIERLGQEITTVQDDADVPAEDRVILLNEAGLSEAEELDDDRFQVMGVTTLDDPASRVENPYIAGGTTSQLLEVAVMADAQRAEISQELGPNVGFTVAASDRDGSIMDIRTSGTAADEVLAAFDPVRDAVAQELQERQDRAEVPRSRHIEVESLAEPASVVDVSPPVDRTVATIVGLGGLLAIAAAIMVESVVSRRRSTKAAVDAQPTWWDSFESELSPSRHERTSDPDVATTPPSGDKG